MSTPPQESGGANATTSLSGLSPVKLALLAQRARSQSDALMRADPIAIVGMACRFPGGANTTDLYWNLLIEGRDVIGPVPPDRWDADAVYDADPATPGKSAVREGGFIGNVDRFDAEFFGILPREAEKMDPQQRLFLEVATEALDNAGLPRERLAGTRTGVFAASYHSDYAHLQYNDREDVDARTLTGTVHSVVSNRLSYLLDLRGPSITVDTACSSSLVAMHLACQSLRYGECDVAITGGVSLMLTQELMISLSKVGFMAPDGRCKTFDDAADGFGRGEGCGVIVLKRLSDAIAAGDKVLALVRGSAVNQDGHSTVLAAPNGIAQRDLIRQALENAQVAPQSIGYVEAHGTGTPLGDPIEVEALAETIGIASPDARPCYIGAAKANIGHMEAAAGVGGVIKSVLILQHGVVPPQVHFRNLNRHIRLEGTRLRISAVAVPWPRGKESRRIATSGFGVGGTNAHVLLEEAPLLPEPPPASTSSGPYLLPVSAQSQSALRELTDVWIGLLSNPPAAPAELCASAATRRSHYDLRLAVVGATTDDLINRLRAAQADLRDSDVATASGQSAGAARIAFVFSGQGPQWFAMGRELAAREAIFAATLRSVDALLTPLSGWSLLDVLAADEAQSQLHETQFAQPALFAIQVALAALWKSWGIEPDAVVGHSIGELAALHVAGVLTLPEAVRIVWLRGSAMQGASGNGAMASVALDEAAAQKLLVPFGDALSIGAVNSPTSVVLSGAPAALSVALADAAAKGVAHRLLPVRFAFHSAQMLPLADSFTTALGAVESRAPFVTFYSTVTGHAMSDGFGAAYFGRNVYQPVRFAAAIDRMLGDGFGAFLEIGPHPVLGISIAECAAQRQLTPVLLASLRRQRPERDTMLQACAALYTAGHTPRWSELNSARPAKVDLPAYPWQRQRFWLRPLPASGTAASSRFSMCLGPRIAAASARIFESSWPHNAPRWLADHRVAGRLLMPAAAMLEALREAACDALATPEAAIQEFIVHRSLVLAEDGAVTTWQVGASLLDSGQWRVELHELLAVPDGQPVWQLVASARAERAAPVSTPRQINSAVREFDAAALQDFYAAFDRLGVQFGPAFRTVRGFAAETARMHALLEYPAVEGNVANGLHPAMLDGALQACIAAATGSGNEVGELLLPVGVDRYQVFGPVPARSYAEVFWQREIAGGSLSVDVRLFSPEGQQVAALEGVRLAPAASMMREAGASRGDDWLYDVGWEPAVRAAAVQPPPPVAWVLVSDKRGAVLELAAALKKTGAVCLEVDPAEVTSIDRLLNEDQWRQGLPLGGVVHLCSLDVPALQGEAGTGAAVDNDQIDRLTSLSGLQLFQSLLRLGAPGIQLILVTCGAQPAGDGVPRPASAGLWGLQAVIAAEHPDFVCRVIDLDAEAPSTDVSALVAEITDSSDRLQRVALRGAQRLRPHMRRLPPLPERLQPVGLQRDASGVLDSLTWRSITLPPPAAGQVQVRVIAAGLNFRDVLLALGMYPDDTGLPLGAECAGIVEAVGADVGAFVPGDAVFGFAASSLATLVNVPAGFLVPVPPALSMEQAAAIPVAFLTAEYGLQRVAGLRAGMSVLVHAAAGGVGMAAVELAQRAGATVFATAGSPAKRALLRARGVAHVLDSRSLQFADDIKAITGGRGVDVVLNSLAGDFIGASVECLAEQGCFLELGKRDLWSPEMFSARRPSARYVVYDLGNQAHAEPDLLPPMLQQLAARFASGALRPLPVRVFAFDMARNAFRYMAQARHIGKVVLRAPVTAASALQVAVRAEATYLITGGLGAIGQQTAQWLVERGARHLVLTARRAPDATARETLEELRRHGAAVHIRQVDAGDRRAMAALIDEIACTMPPLRGIVHAAGIVDDGVLQQQDSARWNSVIHGKAHGARNLHALTVDTPLDFFVLYSAAGLLLGPAGQGAYAAANAELDALAHARRAMGLPATSVAWGMWRDGGMAAGMEARGMNPWSKRGLGWISSGEGFARLQHLLQIGIAHAAVISIDWQRFLSAARAVVDPLWFAGLGRPTRVPEAALKNKGQSSDVVATWRAAPLGQRRSLLISHLLEKSLAVLGLDAAVSIGEKTPLKEAGLDSLMAVELRNSLTRSVGRSLPATLLFDYPTLDALAAYLLRTLELEAREPAAPIAGRNPSVAIAMSEEEAEAQLLAELEHGSTRGMK